MSEVDLQELRQQCSALWMSGRVVIGTSGGRLLVRKHYYPLLVAAWCLLIMGTVCWLVFTRVPDRQFGLFAGFIAVWMCAVFVGLAVYLDRRPPLLDWDSHARRLIIRGQSHAVAAAGPLELALGDVHFSLGGTHIQGEALYVRTLERGGLRVVHVEHGRSGLRKKLEKVPAPGVFSLQPQPSITLSKTSASAAG